MFMNSTFGNITVSAFSRTIHFPFMSISALIKSSSTAEGIPEQSDYSKLKSSALNFSNHLRNIDSTRASFPYKSYLVSHGVSASSFYRRIALHAENATFVHTYWKLMVNKFDLVVQSNFAFLVSK